MPCQHPTVKPFFHKDTFTCVFVVYDAESKDAIVIDSVMDLDTLSWQVSLTHCEEVAKFIDENHLHLKMVIDTHTHADHITGAQFFKARYNVPYGIGDKIVLVQKTFAGLFDLPDFKCDGSQFDRLFKENEEVHAGTLMFRCLPTHGHTPNCLSYIIGDAVFTGDTVFTEDFGTGRCDFPGGSAGDLYDSIQRLYALPPSTRVFVGHDYQPGGREIRFESTIELEREKNEDITCRAEREEFVKMKTDFDKTLNPPRLIMPSLLVNMNGGVLPQPHANGRRYFIIPMNLKYPTDDIGRKQA